MQCTGVQIILFKKRKPITSHPEAELKFGVLKGQEFFFGQREDFNI